MKKQITVLLGLFIFIPFVMQAQIKKERITVSPFTGIETSSIVKVKLLKGNDFIVVKQADKRLFDHLKVYVKNGTLVIKTEDLNHTKGNEKIEVYVTAPTLKVLKSSGASSVATIDPLQGEQIHIVASGAAQIRLELAYKKLEVNVSGAAKVKVQGSATEQHVNASGAASYMAKGLTGNMTVVKASGAASVTVKKSGSLTTRKSGAAKIKIYDKEDTGLFIQNENGLLHLNLPVVTLTCGDEKHTIFDLNNLDIEIIDNEENLTIRLGNNELTIND